MPTFWLSFTDHRLTGDQHLHVIAVADDLDAADEIARRLGAIGEVSIADLDGCDPVPAAFMDRVLADTDIDAMEAAMADKASKVAVIAAIHHACSLTPDDGNSGQSGVNMFGAIQDLMVAGDFGAFDAALSAANVTTMQVVVMVSLLRYSYVSSGSLPSWLPFLASHGIVYRLRVIVCKKARLLSIRRLGIECITPALAHSSGRLGVRLALTKPSSRFWAGCTATLWVPSNPAAAAWRLCQHSPRLWAWRFPGAVWPETVPSGRACWRCASGGV
jgi:hypothetical protein